MNPTVAGLPTKRALLIGIDEYAHLKALRGCTNDARAMDELLRTGFGFTHTTLLLDADATRAGMVGAFEQLIEETASGDIVVVYFAGHGSQLRDREGDEPSGMDSTIMPVDTARDESNPAGSIDITDDELFLFLQRLGNKTTAITVIVDACHSGTITRDATPSETISVRGVPADTRAPTTPSPIPVELWPLLRADGGTAAAPSGWLPMRDHYVVISGCRDDELSGELGLPQADGSLTYHGALTYFLTQTLQNVWPGATYRSVFEEVSAQVTAFRQGVQHPQLEGNIDRELFGMKDIPPMRYVRVASVAADSASITLAAGAAVGFTVGTTVGVYAPGTNSTVGVLPRALADVTDVRALDCTAVVRAEGRDGELTESCRAVVHSAGVSDLRRSVYVQLDPADAAAHGIAHGTRHDIDATPLLEAIGKSAFLRQVQAPTSDALVVRVWSSADAGTVPRWAITAADTLPVAPLKPLDDVGSVVHNLEILARQGLALALTNTNQQSAMMRARPSLTLLVARGDEPFQVAAAGPGGLPVIEEGCWVGLRVTNPHTTAVYISVLDFGLSGKIKPMFPPSGGSDSLAPGEPRDLFVRRGERWKFSLPPVYPYAADGELPVRNDGVETIKLFATSAPASFAFLEETVGVRDAALTKPSAIEQLFRSRMIATRDGDAETPLAPDDDWTTATVSFLVRRKPATP